MRSLHLHIPFRKGNKDLMSLIQNFKIVFLTTFKYRPCETFCLAYSSTLTSLRIKNMILKIKSIVWRTLLNMLTSHELFCMQNLHLVKIRSVINFSRLSE